MTLRHVLIFFIFVPLFNSCAHHTTRTDNLENALSKAEQLQIHLFNNFEAFITEFDPFKAIQSDVQDLYRSVSYRPLWITSKGVQSSSIELITAIEESKFVGLNPQSYCIEYLKNQLNRLQLAKRDLSEAEIKSAARFDVALSVAFLNLIADIQLGRINKAVDPEWYFNDESRSFSTSQLVQATTDSESLRGFINSIHPKNSEYKKLGKALKFLLSLQQSGGWPTLPSDLRLL